MSRMRITIDVNYHPATRARGRIEKILDLMEDSYGAEVTYEIEEVD